MDKSPFRIGSPTFERTGDPWTADSAGDPAGGPAADPNPPELDQGEWIRVSYPLTGFSQPTLWFDVDARYESWISSSCDAAVAVLVILAMREGGDIQVDGHLSPQYWWNLHNTVIPILNQQKSEHALIQVHTENFTDPAQPGGAAIVTGFSCGVDSFSVLADHLLDPDLREEDTISHFLFNDIGSHGVTPEESEERAVIRWRGIRAGAADLKKPVIRVRSNQPAFFGYWPDIILHFDHTLTLRNAAVPLLLQRGIRRWMFASSMIWENASAGEHIYQPVADPILLPAMNTERVELVSVGCEHTRVGKTAQIADMEVVRDHLDVCVRPGDGLDNCSDCEKCIRTLVTLDFLGKLDGFEKTFDLDLYRKNRRRHITEILARPGGFYQKEIVQLMEESGYRAPLGIRMEVLALRAFLALPERWQEIAHGVRRRWRRLTGRG